LYVVLSGELAAQRRLGDDEPVQLGSLKTGDVFGEMSLISETPTTATVVAVRPSTVLFLGREFVSRIVAGVPEIRNYLEELTQERSTENSLVLGEDEIPADERVLI
jgi:cAMP-dependent protein kinase regulator